MVLEGERGRGGEGEGERGRGGEDLTIFDRESKYTI
jgi:hypothetical protein